MKCNRKVCQSEAKQKITWLNGIGKGQTYFLCEKHAKEEATEYKQRISVCGLKKVACDFCGVKGEWKNVIRSQDFQKADGSNLVVCNSCLNYYANGEYDKIKLKGVEK